MGGEALRDLQGLRLEGMGHEFSIEQSERPGGPWITQYRDVSELRDTQNNRLRRSTRTTSALAGWGAARTTLYADGVAALVRGDQQIPYPPVWMHGLEYDLAVAPEAVLLRALAAPDLRAEADVMTQGVPHHVVAFTDTTASGLALPVRLFLNAHTDLPTAVEVARRPVFDIWGEVPYRTVYSLWFLEPGGLRYPHQWDTTLDGTPLSGFTISSLTLNPPTPPDSFAIGEEIRAGYAALYERPGFVDTPLGRPDRPASEIAPGIVEVPGAWDVAFVRQDDGLVILEAPISSAYSEKVLDEAETRFPGVPIKAVVTTSDAWPHFGGLRTYVARGIPVYALDLNVPLLEKLVEASYADRPDLLEQARRAPDFRPVTDRTVLGEGANRIELYPVRGEGSERMMMAYFPEHRLLYGSDLVQPMPDGSFFFIQYPSELADAVRREGLEVEHVFAFHDGVRPWANVLDAVEEAVGAGGEGEE